MREFASVTRASRVEVGLLDDEFEEILLKLPDEAIASVLRRPQSSCNHKADQVAAIDGECALAHARRRSEQRAYAILERRVAPSILEAHRDA